MSISNNSPIIVGLDIGTTKIAAIAGRKNEYGKLEILGYGKADSSGVEHGMVLNIEQCIKSINEAIENCLENNPNLVIKEVYIGIAGHHIKSMQTRGERIRQSNDDVISKNDVDYLIKDQYQTFIPAGDAIIDVIPQDYTVDGIGGILDPKGRTGTKIGANFHIITGDKLAIRNIHRCVKDASLITKDLVLQPLASAAAVMSPEELEAGVAIVDIGGGTTDLAIFHDGILKHTAVIPYAGVNITNDIKQGLGLLKSQAELLKVKFGMALAEQANVNTFITIPGIKGQPKKEISQKTLAQIIQCRIEEIMDHVLFHIKQVNMEKHLNGGIILTGGGSQLKHIVQLTEFMTHINARIGHPNEHLAGGYPEEIVKPIYATCIGLILRGFDDLETQRFRNTTSANSIIDNSGNMFVKVTPSGELTTEAIVEEQVALTDTAADADEAALDTKKQSFMNKQKVRVSAINSIFSNIKVSIMRLFDDIEDERLDDNELK